MYISREDTAEGWAEYVEHCKQMKKENRYAKKCQTCMLQFFGSCEHCLSLAHRKRMESDYGLFTKYVKFVLGKTMEEYIEEKLAKRK